MGQLVTFYCVFNFVTTPHISQLGGRQPAAGPQFVFLLAFYTSHVREKCDKL